MKIINNDSFTTLIADENMMLTREHCFSKQVNLGCNDKIDNWLEITEEEAIILQKELEEDIPEDLIV